MSIRSYIGVCLVLLAGWQNACAGRFFLSTQGSDQGDGSLQAPWATFNHAIWKLRPGDSLLVRQGHYQEGEIWIRKARGMGGADGRYVTLMAYPGEKVELDGPRRMIVDADYMRIQGFTFVNTYSLDFPSWEGPDLSTHAEILDNHFIGNFLLPIEFCGRNSLIQGNLIDSRNGSSHAIYLHYGYNNVLRNNRILGTYKYGIHMYDEHKNEDPQGFVRTYHDITLEGNYVTGCRMRAGIILGTSADNPTPGVTMQRVVIRRNIICENGGQGILVKAWQGRISDVSIYNNTIYQNVEEGIQIENAQNVRIFNNIVVAGQGAHLAADSKSTDLFVQRNLFWPAPPRWHGVEDNLALVADPLIANTGENGFELQPASPAIDSGLMNGLAYNGAAPDLGSRESLQTSSNPSLPRSEETKLRLLHSYPNPFNSRTLITCYLFAPLQIEVSIYDSLGQLVIRLQQGKAAVGWLTLPWDGCDGTGKRMPSGLYFCRITFDDQRIEAKLLLMR